MHSLVCYSMAMRQKPIQERLTSRLDRLEMHVEFAQDDYENLPASIHVLDRSEKKTVIENLNLSFDALLGMGSCLARALRMYWSGDPDEVFDLLVQAGLMSAEQSARVTKLVSQRQAVIDGNADVIADIADNHMDDIIDAGRTLLKHAPDISDEPGTGLHPLIIEHSEALVALAGKHGLTDLRVYGSMARGDADDYSNVDLLVYVPPEAGMEGFLRTIFMISDAQQLLQREVEVCADGELESEQRARILRDAIPLEAPADHSHPARRGGGPGLRESR